MSRTNKIVDNVAYIIMENDNSIQEMSNLQIQDKYGVFYVEFDSVLQSLDCENRNRRYYYGDPMRRGLKRKELEELRANKKWFGEYDHPITTDVNRVSIVLSKESSHRIDSIWFKDNLVMGHVVTKAKCAHGDALAASIIQGTIPSFSLRALASLSKKGAVTYVKQDPYVIAYDEVNLPSHKEAYAVINDESKAKKVIQSIDGRKQVYENSVRRIIEDSNGHKAVYENGAIELDKSMIEYALTQSDNLKAVCESLELNLESIGFKNGQFVTKNGSDRVVINAEYNAAKNVNKMMQQLFR